MTARWQSFDGGPMLGEGEQVRTPSGVLTTPFPAVDVSTSRRATATITRARAWLLENARAEAARQGLSRHALTGADLSNWTASDGHECEAILFHGWSA